MYAVMCVVSRPAVSLMYLTDTATLCAVMGVDRSAPQVAGAAALYLSRFPAASAQEVAAVIVQAGETTAVGKVRLHTV